MQRDDCKAVLLEEPARRARVHAAAPGLIHAYARVLDRPGIGRCGYSFRPKRERGDQILLRALRQTADRISAAGHLHGGALLPRAVDRAERVVLGRIDRQNWARAGDRTGRWNDRRRRWIRVEADAWDAVERSGVFRG